MGGIIGGFTDGAVTILGKVLDVFAHVRGCCCSGLRPTQHGQRADALSFTENRAQVMASAPPEGEGTQGYPSQNQGNATDRRRPA